jgi:hypothetical protein
MRKCPFCLQEIPEDAKVCKHCGKTVVKKCPACAGEIVATARVCRFCNADQDAGPPRALRSDLPCGERREVVMTLLLIFLTCGLYGLVIQYKIGSEINRHQGKNQINAGMDLLLLFLTCGFWGFYMMYKYPTVLMEVIQEEGGTPTDLVLPCLLFAILGLHLVSLLILQGELNRHWEAHQASKV